jgi:hypothetical protein
MADYAHTFNHPGRGGMRVQLRRTHLTPQLTKLLGKLEDASTKVAEAREAERTCGFGTGPKRAEFEKKTRAALDAERDALDAFLGGAARSKRQLADHLTDAYNDAIGRAEKARRDMLDALAEAQEAAALYGCVQSEYAFLDTDHKVGRTPARNAVVFASSTVRDLHLPVLDVEGER